jgi:hypothetical protein
VPARPRPPFDLVIFDNDGVLVDSEWHANGILADLLCEAGLPSTREGCIAEYMGSTLARVREIAELRLGRGRLSSVRGPLVHRPERTCFLSIFQSRRSHEPRCRTPHLSSCRCTRSSHSLPFR